MVKTLSIFKNKLKPGQPISIHVNFAKSIFDKLGLFKATVMQIEKTLINNCLRVSKDLENFVFETFIILQ